MKMFAVIDFTFMLLFVASLIIAWIEEDAFLLVISVGICIILAALFIVFIVCRIFGSIFMDTEKTRTHSFIYAVNTVWIVAVILFLFKGALWAFDVLEDFFLFINLPAGII